MYSVAVVVMRMKMVFDIFRLCGYILKMHYFQCDLFDAKHIFE